MFERKKDLTRERVIAKCTLPHHPDVSPRLGVTKTRATRKDVGAVWRRQRRRRGVAYSSYTVQENKEGKGKHEQPKEKVDGNKNYLNGNFGRESLFPSTFWKVWNLESFG